jgi:hypothetical protein
MFPCRSDGALLKLAEYQKIRLGGINPELVFSLQFLCVDSKLAKLRVELETLLLDCCCGQSYGENEGFFYTVALVNVNGLLLAVPHAANVDQLFAVKCANGKDVQKRKKER